MNWLLSHVIPQSARGRFAARVGLTMLPMLLLWWFGAGLVIDTLRPVARLLIQTLQLGVDVSVAPDGHSWIVDTGLSRATGSQTGAVLTSVPMDEMRRMTLSFPMFLALLITPPRSKPIRGAVIGCLVLAVVFAFCTCTVVFNDVAVIINHRTSLIADNVPPPGFTVTHAPLGEFVFFCAGLSMYLGLQVLPMAIPVVVWAAVNWPGVKQLLDAGGQSDDADAEAPAETEVADTPA